MGLPKPAEIQTFSIAIEDTLSFQFQLSLPSNLSMESLFNHVQKVFSSNRLTADEKITLSKIILKEYQFNQTSNFSEVQFLPTIFVEFSDHVDNLDFTSVEDKQDPHIIKTQLKTEVISSKLDTPYALAEINPDILYNILLKTFSVENGEKQKYPLAFAIKKTAILKILKTADPITKNNILTRYTCDNVNGPNGINQLFKFIHQKALPLSNLEKKELILYLIDADDKNAIFCAVRYSYITAKLLLSNLNMIDPLILPMQERENKIKDLLSHISSQKLNLLMTSTIRGNGNSVLTVLNTLFQFDFQYILTYLLSKNEQNINFFNLLIANIYSEPPTENLGSNPFDPIIERLENVDKVNCALYAASIDKHLNKSMLIHNTKKSNTREEIKKNIVEKKYAGPLNLKDENHHIYKYNFRDNGIALVNARQILDYLPLFFSYKILIYNSKIASIDWMNQIGESWFSNLVGPDHANKVVELLAFFKYTKKFYQDSTLEHSQNPNTLMPTKKNPNQNPPNKKSKNGCRIM